MKIAQFCSFGKSDNEVFHCVDVTDEVQQLQA